MNNEDRDKALYKYPDSNVLRNKFGITDPVLLERRERQFVTARIESGTPKGNFDLPHLQNIHRHLFQDVYTWAGEIRKVDMHKGGSQFHPCERIEVGMADVHKRLSQQQYLKQLQQSDFAKEAAEYIGDVNRLHPFREGNGRTQLQYLKQLGEQAGHSIDLSRFKRESWIRASKEANQFKTDRMADCIQKSITDPVREKSTKQNSYVEERRERIRSAQAQRKNRDQDPKR
jgi:cell filamentation protein